jgi:hypothetical protein
MWQQAAAPERLGWFYPPFGQSAVLNKFKIFGVVKTGRKSRSADQNRVLTRS